MKFYGLIGYGETEETAPGVHELVITKRAYFGDVERNSRQIPQGENLNNDLSVNNSISIVADAYAHEHFHKIQFVEWQGAPWTVTDVDVRSPRLILRLGGVYNGPTS